MFKAIRVEDVFAEPSLTKLRTMPKQLVHRDLQDGKVYAIFVDKNAAGELVHVQIGMVKGFESAADVMARLSFHFEDGIQFGYSIEPDNCTERERQLEKEGRLHYYMIERLVATQLIRPDFLEYIQQSAEQQTKTNAH
jgi:hypothetical protein